MGKGDVKGGVMLRRARGAAHYAVLEMHLSMSYSEVLRRASLKSPEHPSPSDQAGH